MAAIRELIQRLQEVTTPSMKARLSKDPTESIVTPIKNWDRRAKDIDEAIRAKVMAETYEAAATEQLKEAQDLVQEAEAALHELQQTWAQDSINYLGVPMLNRS